MKMRMRMRMRVGSSLRSADYDSERTLTPKTTAKGSHEVGGFQFWASICRPRR
jgi:hypothetical protein